MNIIHKTVRGLGTLPHVGRHPGISSLLFWIAIGSCAGGKSGELMGVIGGAALMTVGLGPLFLYGAYDRARISDRIEHRQQP